MLEVDGLTKRYAEVTALAGVSFRVARGEMLGVIGRSGSGKSTLLRCINRLTEASAGRILWDGAAVTALKGRNLRRWRTQTAMIFQHYGLSPRLDALTNVLIGRLFHQPWWRAALRRFPAEERARALIALERVGLLEVALRRADTLSGGQQQRVAIARALAQAPQMILADEPIASLDPINADAVMQTLREINRTDGITIIANLHDLDYAREYCDRLIGLAAGRIVFDGPPVHLTRAAEALVYEDPAGAAGDTQRGAA